MSNNYSTTLNGGSLQFHQVNLGYCQPSHQQAQYSSTTSAQINEPHPIQYANAYSFNANTQGLPVNGHPVPPSAVPRLEQLRHDSLPPSPVGAMARRLPQYTQNKVHPLPSKPLTVSALITDRSTDQGKGLAAGSREDGELSDGELNKQVNLRSSSVPGAVSKPPRQSPTEARKHSSSSRNCTYSISTMRSGKENPTSDLSLSQDIDQSRSEQSSRARARTALQDLFSSNIDYAKLVEEGLNPQILRGLCTEIGVQLASPTVQDHVSKVVREDLNESKPICAVKDTTVDLVPAMPQPNLQPNYPEIPPSQPINISTVAEKVNDNSTPRMELKDFSATRDPKPQILPGPISGPPSGASLGVVNSPGLSVRSKHLGTKPGEKGIERKEYIARMLAAKNSKLIPSASPSLPSINAAGLAVTTAARHSPVSVHADPSNMNAGPIPHEQNTPENIPQRITDMSEKKKAQTELARQRMNALNHSSSNTLAKSQAPSGGNAFSIEQRQANVLPRTAPSSQPPMNPPFQQFEPSQAVSTGVIPSTSHISSYAPIRRVPSFASPIPGLFMGSSQPPPPAVSATFPAQSTKLTSHPIPQSFTSQNSNLHPQPISNISSQSTSVQPSADPDLVENEQPSKESRKRQKAADFLDSPPVRVKRPLGQSEDTQVIIEISEDEEMGFSEDDRDRTLGYSSRLSADIRSDNLNGSKQRAIRDLPPLTNFPYHKKSLTKSALSTPPSVRTPMTANGRDLMTEIQILHQKIAEAERKKNTGPIASSNQTLGTPRFLASTAGTKEPPSTMTGTSNGFNEPSPQHEHPTTVAPLANNLPEEPESEARDATDVSEARYATQTLSKDTPTTNQSEHDNSAKNTLIQADALDSAKQESARELDQIAELEPLELEHARAARIASEKRVLEQQKRYEEQMRIEAAREKDVEDARQEQVLIERRMQEARLAQIETERVKAAEAARDEQLLVEQQKREAALARVEAERKKALETAKLAEKEQRLRRKSEIESGLPILDAEVERTKQRLQKLRKEIEVLEDEVLKGVQGRRILMEELDQIGQQLSDTEDDKRPVIERTSDLSTRDYRGQSVDAGDAQSTFAAPQDTNGRIHPNRTETPQSRPSPVFLTKETSSADKLAGDLMDISDSDEDDGEITDRTPNSPTNNAATTVSGDDEEMYEPPTTFEYHPLPEYLVDEELPQGLTAAENSNQAEIQQSLSNDQEVQMPNATQVVTPSPTVSDALISTQLPRNPIHVDIDESDSDYEPPEPALLVDRAESLTIDLANKGKTSSVTSETMQIAPTILRATEENARSKAEQSGPQEATKVSKQHRASRFTPYQSALKQFKSFRNHPDFVSEVPGGFRSLTYSQKINPHIPLCQYEAAGGRCNDASCDSQHFRNMGLSDDLILVQLGSQPEGLDAAQNTAYVTGLKQVIQEMREKKIKDFNVVSSKITAYRSKFLGDTTRILPL